MNPKDVLRHHVSGAIERGEAEAIEGQPVEYTVADFNADLEYGPYAWPGGYPRYFVASDGAALSFQAARDNADLIRGSIADRTDDGWRVMACEINWEDAELVCDHTGERIESAYGDDE